MLPHILLCVNMFLWVDKGSTVCYTILKLIDTQPLEEPTNEDQHRSTRRENFSNMSTTQPVIKITYNKEDRDYIVIVNRNILGYARTYAEGEEMVRAYSADLAALVACNVTMKEAA
jgi:hypothetical protein